MIFVTLNRPYDFQEDDLRLIFEVGKYRFEAVLLNDLLDILKISIDIQKLLTLSLKELNH